MKETGERGVGIRSLGHVAIRVSDRERAERFYSGVLGLPIRGHLGDDMTFFGVNADQFQDLAVIEVSTEEPTQAGQLGLDHVAFRVGNSLDELRTAVERLRAHGIEVGAIMDHTWSNSVYFSDPDGNGIELYVDRSDIWKTDTDFVPTATKLAL